MSGKSFSLDVQRRTGFQFDVSFDGADWPSILMDEPAPVGADAGPNASRMLAAAIGNCLAASLLFCLEKARVPVSDLTAHVEASVERNERGRMRIGGVKVVLKPSVDGLPSGRLARCLDLFEDFCVVTQSVRQGIDVQVEVEPEGVVEGPGEEAPA